MRRAAPAAATAAGAMALSACTAAQTLEERGLCQSCTDVGVFEVVSVDLTGVLPFEGGDHDVALSLPETGLTVRGTLVGNSEGPLEITASPDLDDEPTAVVVEARGTGGQLVYRGSGTQTPAMHQPNGPRCDPADYWLTLHATASGALVPAEPFEPVRDAQGRTSMTLYTTCGVLWFDDPSGATGPWVREAGLLDDGAGGPPLGWSAPFQRGWAAVDGERVVFEDERGHREVFRPTTSTDRFEQCLL